MIGAPQFRGRELRANYIYSSSRLQHAENKDNIKTIRSDTITEQHRLKEILST
jgi:hypothetical protein